MKNKRTLWRRLFLTALIVAFVLGSFAVIGCQQQTTTTTTQATTTQAGQTTTTAATEPQDVGLLYDELTEWTILVSEFVNAPTSDDQMAWVALAERFNVQLKFEVAPGGADFVTRRNLALASGNPHHIINGVPPEYWPTGIVVDLTPYMEEHGWAFLAEVNKDPVVAKNVKDDLGRYFFFPTIMWHYETIHQHINVTYLEQAGINELPSTTDEFFDAMVAMKALNPDHIIPWAQGSWHFHAHGLQQVIYWAFGTSQGWWHFEEGQYLYGPYQRQEQMREALRYLNKAWNAGIIDPEFLSATQEEFVNQRESGRLGFFLGWPAGGVRWIKPDIDMFANVPLREEDRDEWMDLDRVYDGHYWKFLMPLEGPEGHQRAYTKTDTLNTRLMIMNTHPDPEKAVQFFNWFYTDEGEEFSNWGLEGVTFERLPDGTRTFTDEYKEFGSQLMNDGLRANGFFPVHFIYLHNHEANVYLRLQEHLLDFIGGMHPYSRPDNPVLTPLEEELDEQTELAGDIYAYVNENLPQFVTGSLDIDRDWDNFISTIERMGVERLIEVVGGQYERWQDR